MKNNCENVLVLFMVRIYDASVSYKCLKSIFFLVSYTSSLTVEKHYLTYGFPYFDIFILSEWRNKGFPIAPCEVNNMGAQKRKF